MQRTVESAIRIDDRDSVSRETTFKVLREHEPVAARLQLRRKAIVHAARARIPDEIGIVADQMLVVRYKETIAVDGIGRGIEGVGLTVKPVALGLVIVSLVFEDDVIGERP